MKLTIDLPDDEVTALCENAERQGVSAEVYARVLIERDLKAHERVRVSPKLRHISEVMAEIMAGVPPGPPE